ncbi:unnamed protein product [Penicillium olsonii]|nr:unnamed protein product [Penicillium olsonii]CAG7918688.1 unnamed protein product [Penicillium olsonii]
MENVPVTAKWANRVLRPLTSIYRRLEKHQATLAAESKQRAAAAGNHEDPYLATSIAPEVDNCLETDEEPEREDPVWVPGYMMQRMRSRRKYSSRPENDGPNRRHRLSIQSPEASRTLPGAIEVATPLITGKRWEMPSSAQSCRSVEPTNNITPDPPSPVYRGRSSRYNSPWRDLLEMSGDERLLEIAINLDKVFMTFLLSTGKSRRKWGPNPFDRKYDRRRRGARSLMAMVARRLPEYIAKEQEAQDELDEDGDEDMCDAYFTELEAYYAPHGTGWAPLREAVRAQGMYMIRRMIKDNWLTDAIACSMIERCRATAPEESDSMLSTLISTRETYPYPHALKPIASPNVLGDPILLFRSYAAHETASRTFIFDELAKLLLRGALPPEWMGTKHWTTWMSRATISISKQDRDWPAASRLIESVILSASSMRFNAPAAPCLTPAQKARHKPVAFRARRTRTTSTEALADPSAVRLCSAPVEDALSNHVVSLLAALCGIHFARSRASLATGKLRKTKASSVIDYLYFVLQQYANPEIMGSQDALTYHQLLRRGCILVAASLVQCSNNTVFEKEQATLASTTSVDKFASSIAARPDIIKELAYLLQQSFRCLNVKGGGLRTSKDIRQMVSQFASIAETPGMSIFLGNIATEVAMFFAEVTADPDDHVWAVEMQEMVTKKQAQLESDGEAPENAAGSSQNNGLFRWEDSIGEWVETTPATKKTVHLAQKGRAPMRIPSSPAPSIPCSTASSSPEPGPCQDSASSVASSPAPARAPSPVKRSLQDIDVSQIQPKKRRRHPVVVCDHAEVRSRETSSASTPLGSRAESATHREILRERSTNLERRIVPTTRLVPKVVIINSEATRPSQRPAQRSPERGEKRIHRTLDRRRSARHSVVPPNVVRRRSSDQPVIPCSQDSGSDDELSFL